MLIVVVVRLQCTLLSRNKFIFYSPSLQNVILHHTNHLAVASSFRCLEAPAPPIMKLQHHQSQSPEARRGAQKQGRYHNNACCYIGIHPPLPPPLANVSQHLMLDRSHDTAALRRLRACLSEGVEEGGPTTPILHTTRSTS